MEWPLVCSDAAPVVVEEDGKDSSRTDVKWELRASTARMMAPFRM